MRVRVMVHCYNSQISSTRVDLICGGDRHVYERDVHVTLIIKVPGQTTKSIYSLSNTQPTLTLIPNLIPTLTND